MQILYIKSAEQPLEGLMLMMRSKYSVKWETAAFNGLQIHGGAEGSEDQTEGSSLIYYRVVIL